MTAEDQVDKGPTTHMREVDTTLDVDLFGTNDFSVNPDCRTSTCPTTPHTGVAADSPGEFELASLYQPATLAPPASRSNSSLLRLGVFGLLAVAVMFGVLWAWQQWGMGSLAEQTDNAYLRADIVTITPQVSGQVTAVAVKDNEAVAAGDTLMSIDNTAYLANRQKAEADIHAAEAALGNLSARVDLQHTRIEAARAGVQATAAALDYAKAENARYETLQRSGTATLQNEQDAKASLTQSVAAHARANAQVSSAEKQLDVLASEKQQHQADLARAQALLTLAAKDVKNTVIQAPRDGILGQSGVYEGEYVRAGQSLMLLVPADDLYVMANFEETQIKHFRKGMPATIKIDAFDGREIEGVIDSIAPATEAEFSVLPPDNTTLAVMASGASVAKFNKTTQRIAVKIRPTIPDDLVGTLRPGMSVVARVEPEHSDD